MPVSERVLARLRGQAGSRCAYCRTSSLITGQPLTVDHIVPTARGGGADASNLCLACRRCNEAKSTHTDGIDRETGDRVPLFNPRTQSWGDHFVWSGDGKQISGRTPCGRVTIDALRMNHPDIVAARRLWVAVGWHPPL